MHKPKILVILSLVTMLGACAYGVDQDASNDNKPQSPEDTRKESRGKLTGENGLLIGGVDEDKGASSSPLGVNAYLWRASLDTISFMPMAAADPFGGTILTDWYEDPKSPGSRFKVNVLI